MAKPTPRSVQRAQTRAALLQATQELLQARGIREVGIRDITAHAHLSLATFYLHFDSKDDVLRQLAHEIGALLDASLQAFATGESPAQGVRARTRAGVGAFLDHAEQRRPLFLLLDRDWSEAPAGARDIIVAARARFVRSVADRLAKSVQPPLPSVRAAVAAEAATAGVLRLVRRWLEEPALYPRGEVVETLCDLIVGLVRRKEPERGR